DSPLASSLNTPRHAIARITAVTAHTARGRTLIRLPTRDQKPVWVGSAEPKTGRTGQNIQRPKITRSAGSSVTMTSSVTATPTARTGPRLAVELRSAND